MIDNSANQTAAIECILIKHQRQVDVKRLLILPSTLETLEVVKLRAKPTTLLTSVMSHAGTPLRYSLEA